MATLLATGLAAKASAAGDLFRDQVAPILQRRCLSCHNETDRRGDLSLTTGVDLREGGYIDADRSDDSHLLEVITPVDGAAKMPKDADPLTAEQIQAVRRWLAAGAPWPDDVKLTASEVKEFDGWSYQPIRHPTPPALADPWIRNPIDAFILDTLRQQRLSPAPPADRRALIRRLSFDLIGLPPSPDDVRRFVADSSPDAYEQLVDRLLESPQYGERWARHWLDVVKYADTCGYDKDKLRPNAWPYRDYVIRSLNEDKPYARFVQEQIAGDVLFPGEPDGILGLGFIAAGPWDFIGHVEVPESKLDGKVARNLDRDDMVCNVVNTFCSVTIQCARCHNHKFDPITQQHYYALQNIFAAVDRADRVYDLDPAVSNQRQQLTETLRERRSQLEKVEAEVRQAGGERLAGLNMRIAELSKQVKVRKAPEFGYHSQTSADPAIAKWAAIELAGADEPAVALQKIVLRPCHDEFGGIGAGFGFPLRFRMETSTDGQQWEVVADETQRDFPNPGLTPYEIALPAGTAVRQIRVTATRLAPRQGVHIFALAELQALTANGENAAVGAKVTSLDSIEAPVRWRRSNLTDGKWAEGADAEVSRELAALESQRRELLAAIETPERMERRRELQEAIAAAERQLAGLPAGRLVYAAATRFDPQGNFKPTLGKLRPIHVLRRGKIEQPGDPAHVGVLPLSEDASWQLDEQLDEGQRRAALARWLTDPEHPLVWRSIVNRVWQHHFGEGIVATPNDFGRMGAKPSHPELLDWLANEFRQHQSLKTLHRQIVTSSVYRQSTAFDPDKAALDAGNRYLWRMNRRRLEAEEVRDAMLLVSGALNPFQGGPGFYLFMLEKTAHSPHYEYHKFDPADPASHRRSIYRFIVRSQPDPWMTTLDCADSSQSTPKRNETLTALQALSLLNNRFNLEMARRFAARLRENVGEQPSPAAMVRRAVDLSLQREPTNDELEALTTYAEQHGMENLCRLVLNFSEFLYLE
ncbi:MAG: DUF1553 domain-containing protein [Planctomycetales bacterium]|nr:DUF1553 domain-containing protein [Planctomycetales bacterium]